MYRAETAVGTQSPVQNTSVAEPAKQGQFFVPAVQNKTWWSGAACSPDSMSAFGDGPATSAELDEWAYVQKYCAGCPVVEDCFSEAMIAGDVEGARGGFTGAQRRQLMVEYRRFGKVQTANMVRAKSGVPVAENRGVKPKLQLARFSPEMISEGSLLKVLDDLSNGRDLSVHLPYAEYSNQTRHRLRLGIAALTGANRDSWIDTKAFHMQTLEARSVRLGFELSLLRFDRTSEVAPKITESARRVWLLAATGYNNQQIADETNLTLGTVKVTKSRTFDTIGANTAAHAGRIRRLMRCDGRMSWGRLLCRMGLKLLASF